MSLTTFPVPARTGNGTSSNKLWLRALELTAPISKNPSRLFADVIEERAETSPDAPALLSSAESFTYGQLAERSNQYTRWALSQGLTKGDTVCLMMPNRPEYMAIWLGASRTGCAVALINTNLTGPSLAHSINIVAPKHVIIANELASRFASARHHLTGNPKIWSGDLDIEQYARGKLRAEERTPLTVADRALYIYTSGTTGLPKAANVSHARLMQWSHWFAGMMETSANDRLYNCLPMYHSVGGVLATGAVLATGGSVVIRESFSASQFWDELVRWDCTLFQYIGELCRYLLNTAANPLEAQHRIRMCCGNGLRPDIWEEFKSRFHIPKILEFYAATEGNVSFFNVEGKPGSIGRIPNYLAHRFPAALVRFDVDKDEPVRDEQGLCVRCRPHETGEAIGRIFEDSSSVGKQFEGYTSTEASQKKILRDVFEPGDAWFRTGDLMRFDEKGYFYFVDRIGDTFRWKGENVATTEVAEAICAFEGIEQANVCGVTVPGADGKAGMAAIVTSGPLNLEAFRTHLYDRLPEYAHPLFLRVRREMEITGTFKFTKNIFATKGYDPGASGDAIFFNDRARGAFVVLSKDMFERIQSGEIKPGERNI